MNVYADLVLFGGSHDDGAAVLVGHTPGQPQLGQCSPQLVCNRLQCIHLLQCLIHQRLLFQALQTAARLHFAACILSAVGFNASTFSSVSLTRDFSFKPCNTALDNQGLLQNCGGRRPWVRESGGFTLQFPSLLCNLWAGAAWGASLPMICVQKHVAEVAPFEFQSLVCEAAVASCLAGLQPVKMKSWNGRQAAACSKKASHTFCYLCCMSQLVCHLSFSS